MKSYITFCSSRVVPLLLLYPIFLIVNPCNLVLVVFDIVVLMVFDIVVRVVFDIVVVVVQHH